MQDLHDLQRFVDAQEGTFERALAELKDGSKQGHWMWLIFPQLAGLGRSPTAQFYAIASLVEAKAYLDHPLLGQRLRQSVSVALPWADHRSAEHIFGAVDALKLRSSMTLFDEVEPGGMFGRALAAYFAGERDGRTLALLNEQA